MTFKGRKSANKILPFTPRHHDVESITAPAYLPPEEQKLYNKIAVDIDLRTNSAAVILEIAMQNHARMRSCRDVLKKEGMTVAGPNGVKAHPLLAAERAAQVQMLTALRRLGVTNEG